MMPKLRRYLWAILLVAILVCTGISSADEASVITLFSSSETDTVIPKPWEPLTFPKIPTPTRYRAIQRNGRIVIEARSQGGASGLMHPLDIDPATYPWLTWQWQVEHALEGADVATKAGDDCAARIYVAFKFDGRNMNWWERFQYKTKRVLAGREIPGSAISYAWSNKGEAGSIIDSPYTRYTKLIVIESGNKLKGRWITERRNMVDDYRAAFGISPPAIMGIAIMSDTDNTGASVTAYYGDIRLESNATGTGPQP
jgi:hypothetical protein